MGWVGLKTGLFWVGSHGGFDVLTLWSCPQEAEAADAMVDIIRSRLILEATGRCPASCLTLVTSLPFPQPGEVQWEIRDEEP